MHKGRFDHVLVPVASPEDAERTATALTANLDVARATVAYVVEKAGGAPDKASMEQRERAGVDAFAAFREALNGDTTVETAIVYDTDIADGLVRAADDAGVDAIVFRPRGGGWFTRVLSGNVTRDLIDGAALPVVVLPEVSP